MTESVQDIQKIRQELEERRERLQKQLAEVDQAIAGIDTAMRLSKNVKRSLVSSPQKNMNLSSDVKNIIQEFYGEFNINDIIHELKVNNPGYSVSKYSVSGVLNRLIDQGLIEIKEQGSGRRPNSYILIGEKKKQAHIFSPATHETMELIKSRGDKISENHPQERFFRASGR